MLELNVNPNFKRTEIVPVPAQTLKLKSIKKFICEIDFFGNEDNIKILEKIEQYFFSEMKKPKTKLTQLVPYPFIVANQMMGYSLEENKMLIDAKYNVCFEINTIKMITHRMGLLIKGSEKEDDNFVMESTMAKNKINCPNRDKGTIKVVDGIEVVSTKQIESLARSRNKQKLAYQIAQQEQGKEVRTTVHTKKHSGFGIRQMIDK